MFSTVKWEIFYFPTFWMILWSRNCIILNMWNLMIFLVNMTTIFHRRTKKIRFFFQNYTSIMDVFWFFWPMKRYLYNLRVRFRRGTPSSAWRFAPTTVCRDEIQPLGCTNLGEPLTPNSTTEQWISLDKSGYNVFT